MPVRAETRNHRAGAGHCKSKRSAAASGPAAIPIRAGRRRADRESSSYYPADVPVPLRPCTGYESVTDGLCNQYTEVMIR